MCHNIGGKLSHKPKYRITNPIWFSNDIPKIALVILFSPDPVDSCTPLQRQSWMWCSRIWILQHSDLEMKVKRFICKIFGEGGFTKSAQTRLWCFRTGVLASLSPGLASILRPAGQQGRPTIVTGFRGSGENDRASRTQHRSGTTKTKETTETTRSAH